MTQPAFAFEPSQRFNLEKTRPIVPQMTAAVPPPEKDKRGDPAGNTPEVRTAQMPLLPETTDQHLFHATAAAKIWTAQVGMHLNRSIRDRLFRQLDVLHESDEWDDGDSPIALESYKSLVRAILFHSVNSRPALALMPSGNVLALWEDGSDKLTVEFLPENRTRWLVQHAAAEGPERIAGTTPLERLRDVLQPYGAERWFDGR